MLSLLIVFAVVSSGGMLGLIFPSCKYEKMLPITCMSLVLILFLFGLFGQLNAGFYFVLVLSLLAYALVPCICIYKEGRKHGIIRLFSRLAKNFLTPSALVFLICFLIIAYANLGRRVVGWDEFSHWATVVKQMTLFDILGSSRDAVFVMFHDYPPAMALFQYFVQKVFLLVDPAAGFCDWRLYFAYQLFMYSFLFPFLSSLDYRRLYTYVLIVIIMFAPFFVFNDTLSSLYIDSFLGLLSGVGLAIVLLRSDKDPLSDITVFLIISTLVLTKAAGLLFSVFLAISYIVLSNTDFFSAKLWRVFNWKRILPAAACVAVPKILWEISLKINGVAKHFTGKISIPSLISLLTGQTPDSYRITTFKKYFLFLLREKSVTVFNYEVPILLFFSFLFLLLLCSVLILMNQFPLRRTAYKVFFWIVFVQVIFYILGLLLCYMFKFGEGEALSLASCSRYLSIIFNSLWMLSILAFVSVFKYVNINKSFFSGLILCAMLLTSQVDTFANFILRNPREISLYLYDIYSDYFNSVTTNTEEDSTIYFISQEDTGYDFLLNKYNLMPRRLNPFLSWSIGEPFYDGDSYTLQTNAEEWGQTLKQNYDYVILFKLNDYFYEEFGVLFEDPGEIQPYSVYRVNKQTGMLSRVGQE